MTQPRRFQLHRTTDVNGVAGTGHVADGIVFSDGHAAIHWLSRRRTTTPHPEGMESVEEIHCYDGNTTIVWLDQEDDQPDAAAQVRGAQAWMADDLHAALGHPVNPGQSNQGQPSWGDHWAALTEEIRELRRERDARNLDGQEGDQ